MKQKLIALCGALCLLLAGCGGGGSGARPFTADDVQTLLDAGIFSEELEPVDADLVCPLYGLDEALVSDCAAYLSTGATAEELVLFTAADESGAQTIKTACEQRLADQIAAYEDYGPAEVTKLEGAVLQVRGTTVLLVVADDAAGATSAVDGLT